MRWNPRTLSIARWAGRVLALVLFLFWGAFFVEHLQEWSPQILKGAPPTWVWLALLAHLTLLIGLVALWRWPVAGSLLTIAGSLAFFGGLALHANGGRSLLTALAFLAVTITPALLTLAGASASHRLKAEDPGNEARAC